MMSATMAPARRSPPSRDRWTLVALAVIVIVGAAIRFHALGDADLGVDEATSVALARMPWPAFLRALWSYEANMSLYYTLLSGWLALGDSEAMIRALSALLGTATLPAIYVLGRHLFGRRTGLVASAFLSLHVMHLVSSEQARSYSLVVLLVTLATYFFVRLVETPGSRRFQAGYVTCAALAPYAHFFAVLLLATHWLSLGPADWRRAGRTLLPLMLILGIGVAPLAAFVLMNDKGQLDWIQPVSFPLLVHTLLFLSGWNPLVLILTFAGAVGAVRATRKPASPPGTVDKARRTDDVAWKLRLLALGALFPITVIVVASFAKPLLLDRYLAISMPSIALLSARALDPAPGASRLRRALLFVLLAAALVLHVMAVQQFELLSPRWADDWREPVTYLLSHAQDGDAVVFVVTSSRDAYEYYRRRLPQPSPGAPRLDVVLPADGVLATIRREAPERIREAVAGRPRVWLVLHRVNQSDEPAIRDAFASGFMLDTEQVFGESRMEDVRVARYIARSPTPAR
jgi:mannosyltransferase